MPEKVGIILVNYNGKKYIANCIDSLLAQTYKNIDILFWDNHSTDASVTIVKRSYPQVHLIESSYNYGFAKANNLAVKEMLRMGAHYLLLLNVDTVADPYLVERLLEKADSNTVTTAKIFTGRRKNEIWYNGGRLLFDKGGAEDRGMKDYKKATRVTFITGCCMMIHRDIIRKYGLFDNDYFMYYEDVDLCMCWYLAGVHMYYIPDARLWHKGSASSGGGRTPLSEYYMARNRLYFVHKFEKYMETSMLGVLYQLIKYEKYFILRHEFQLAKYVFLGIIDYYMGKKGQSRRTFP